MEILAHVEPSSRRAHDISYFSFQAHPWNETPAAVILRNKTNNTAGGGGCFFDNDKQQCKLHTEDGLPLFKSAASAPIVSY